MAIDVIDINGKNEYIDYNYFEESVKSVLAESEYAKVYLINKFPLVLSEETLVDILLIIALKDTWKNTYKFEGIDGTNKYLKNLILPISFVTGHVNDKISCEGNALFYNDYELNFEHEVFTLKDRFYKYLVKRCNLTSEKSLHVHPLFFIENDDSLAIENHLVGTRFSFFEIDQYLKSIPGKGFVSNYDWTSSGNSQDPYDKVSEDVTEIVRFASHDSRIGYLTRQKIERIGRKVARSTKKEKDLNESLMIISGKAGTGKSTEMLTLMTKTLQIGKNALFLTYNKLLVFDLSVSLNAIVEDSEVKLVNHGTGSFKTLHSFFYGLSKKLGVLHIMSKDRIYELKGLLRERLKSLYRYVKSIKTEKYLLSDPTALKESIQNNANFDIGTKELGIDLSRYLDYQSKTLVAARDELFNEFYNRQLKRINNIATKNIFLADYYGVLKNCLDVINDPDTYFDEKGVQDLGELLNEEYNLDETHFEGDKFLKSAFKKKKNNKLGGFRYRRTVFVDEAQDCHYLEKDILVKVFDKENIVVANGGTEQLIRHVELCNWEYSQGSNLSPKKYRTTNKSYRVKKHLLELCEFIGNKYGINLDLEPYQEKENENPDLGKIIIDLRHNPLEEEIDEIISSLIESARVQGCSNYESLLIMLETVGFKNIIGDKESDDIPELGVVNEYGNIEDDIIYERDEWKYIKNITSDDLYYNIWDGTRHDKTEDGIPTQNDLRLIFYESCRGLEAWNAMCLSIDTFFDKKYGEDDAEKYLVSDEAEVLTTDMFLSNEERKKMYAATWILMATTRAMDSLYLHIEDKNSEFGKTIMEFIESSPDNVKVITDNS